MFLGVQQRLDRLNTVLQENLAGVRVVKAFVRQDHEAQRFEKANEDLTKQSANVLMIFAILFPNDADNRQRSILELYGSVGSRSSAGGSVWATSSPSPITSSRP